MDGSAYDWLPDRHLGVAATLSHVDDLIGQVGDLLFDYQTQPGGTFSLEEVLTAAGSHSQTVVQRIAPIPRKVPLLVADALVALRAALEHVLFTEAEFLSGAPLGEKAARLVEMPAAQTFEKFKAWQKQRSRNAAPVLQPGSELVRRIYGLQPLHRLREPDLHPLALLVLHTNHAKHRTPAITAVRLAAMYSDDEPPRSMSELPQRSEEPLRCGEVIGETPLGSRVPLTLFPTVGINRPGTNRWPVLMKELAEIAEWVRTQALPRLITGTDPPEPAFRTRYNITVGHDDERAAILAGSTTSAAELHTERLTSAVARQDFLDLLASLNGAPGQSQIAAWLESLTDTEVFSWQSRLLTNFTQDVHTMRHNLELLQRMCDDALSFVGDRRPTQD